MRGGLDPYVALRLRRGDDPCTRAAEIMTRYAAVADEMKQSEAEAEKHRKTDAAQTANGTAATDSINAESNAPAIKSGVSPTGTAPSNAKQAGATAKNGAAQTAAMRTASRNENTHTGAPATAGMKNATANAAGSKATGTIGAGTANAGTVKASPYAPSAAPSTGTGAAQAAAGNRSGTSPVHAAGVKGGLAAPARPKAPALSSRPPRGGFFGGIVPSPAASAPGPEDMYGTPSRPAAEEKTAVTGNWPGSGTTGNSYAPANGRPHAPLPKKRRGRPPLHPPLSAPEETAAEDLPQAFSAAAESGRTDDKARTTPPQNAKTAFPPEPKNTAGLSAQDTPDNADTAESAVTDAAKEDAALPVRAAMLVGGEIAADFAPQKRKRGRPPKEKPAGTDAALHQADGKTVADKKVPVGTAGTAKNTAAAVKATGTTDQSSDAAENAAADTPPKRKRGRPRKQPQ